MREITRRERQPQQASEHGNRALPLAQKAKRPYNERLAGRILAKLAD
jgi:hypothetical protein